MALTFTQTKATLDELSQRINGARNRVEIGKASIRKAQEELAALASTYSSFITELNDAATNDTWARADVQKAEKDQMVADFTALKAEIDAIVTTLG